MSHLIKVDDVTLKWTFVQYCFNVTLKGSRGGFQCNTEYGDGGIRFWYCINEGTSCHLFRNICSWCFCASVWIMNIVLLMILISNLKNREKPSNCSHTLSRYIFASWKFTVLWNTPSIQNYFQSGLYTLCMKGRHMILHDKQGQMLLWYCANSQFMVDK